jgi:hypothetical protein
MNAQRESSAIEITHSILDVARPRESSAIEITHSILDVARPKPFTHNDVQFFVYWQTMKITSYFVRLSVTHQIQPVIFCNMNILLTVVSTLCAVFCGNNGLLLDIDPKKKVKTELFLTQSL